MFVGYKDRTGFLHLPYARPTNHYPIGNIFHHLNLMYKRREWVGFNLVFFWHDPGFTVFL